MQGLRISHLMIHKSYFKKSYEASYSVIILSQFHQKS